MNDEPSFNPARFRVHEWRLFNSLGMLINTFDHFEDMRKVMVPGDIWEEWQKTSSHIVLESEIQR